MAQAVGEDLGIGHGAVPSDLDRRLQVIGDPANLGGHIIPLDVDNRKAGPRVAIEGEADAARVDDQPTLGLPDKGVVDMAEEDQVGRGVDAELG